MSGQKTTLDTTNTEHILYKKPPLEITILGGVRLDGLGSAINYLF